MQEVYIGKPLRGGVVPDPVWVWSKWLLAFPKVPFTPGHCPRTNHIFAVLPPERMQQGSMQLLQNRSPVFSLLPFSCPSSSSFLLLLLMSGNVHPKPGPVFSCSVCAENVTWRGRSMQCCSCSKWVHLKCSLLSSKFRTFGSSHS